MATLNVNTLKQARDEGYSDNEIAEYVNDPRINSALNEGYSIDEVIEHLERQQPTKQATPQPQAAKQPFNVGNYIRSVAIEPAKSLYQRDIERAKSVIQPTRTAMTIGQIATNPYIKQAMTQPQGYVQESMNRLVSLPERFGRGGAQAAASIADLVNTYSPISAINRISGGKIGEIGQKVMQPIAPIAQKYQQFKESLPPSEKANLEATIGGLEAAAMLGGAKASPKIVAAPGAAVRATGKGIEETGKQILKGELKIEKPLAKKYGRTLAEAKQKAVTIISDNNLESVTGDFNKLAERAKEKFIERVKKADDLIIEYEKVNPDIKTNVENVFKELKEKWTNENIRPGERQTARNYIQSIQDEIMGDALEKGTSLKSVSPTQLVAIKRSIGAKYKNFDRSLEPLKESVYDEVESSIIRKINGLVPEAGKLNLQARDLKYVKDVADAASARIANQNKGIMGGLTDIGLGSAGAAGIYTHPEQTIPIIATTISAMAARRAAGQGRGAAILMKAGKGLQKMSLIKRR